MLSTNMPRCTSQSQMSRTRQANSTVLFAADGAHPTISCIRACHRREHLHSEHPLPLSISCEATASSLLSAMMGRHLARVAEPAAGDHVTSAASGAAPTPSARGGRPRLLLWLFDVRGPSETTPMHGASVTDPS